MLKLQKPSKILKHYPKIETKCLVKCECVRNKKNIKENYIVFLKFHDFSLSEGV